MSEADILIEASLNVEGSTLEVLRYRMLDALSELSTVECEATELDVEPRAPSELLGKTAELVLARTDGQQSRSFFGRVVRAARAADEDDVRTLHLTIAPVPWALSKRADCRVFQKKSAVDIAKEVLEKAGVSADRQEWSLTAEHPVRPYLVQYRESDLAFLQRILSEEGIYFAVHHRDGKDVLVLGDDPRGLGDVEEPKALPFHHGAGFETAFDRVMRVRQTLEIRSDKVMLRDYEPDKPKLALEAEVESQEDGEHVLEIYDYPARAADPAEAKRLAQVLLDEVERDRKVIEGETGALTLAPGLRFSIELHPYEPLNGEYIVTEVRIEGSSPRLGGRAGARGVEDQRYRCSFSAVPSKTKLAPPARPRAARVVGLQTAVTTGSAGEEIHVSDKGEVTVRYFWDRLGPEDDTSSLFVRTLQLPLGDSMLLPRMGWEVSVNHLEGDPDRPLVMGRMYDGIHKPPYALPGDAARSSLQTATTPGGGSVNEFRTTDTKGSEEMFFNASKDASIDVKNNTTESVANNCARNVGSNQNKNVTNSSTASVGGSQKVSVGGNQALKVETQLQDEVGGDHTLSVGGNRDMKVGGDHKRDVGGSSTLSVGGMQTDLVVGSVTDDALGSFSHTVGAALVDITAADRALTVGGSITETAGAAKVVAVAGGRGVEVGGSMTQQVAGAIVHIASGDRAEAAGATYTEIAAGAQLVKADNITIEADSMLSLVMGASTLTLTPALVALAGVSIKLDGPLADVAALVVDN